MAGGSGGACLGGGDLSLSAGDGDHVHAGPANEDPVLCDRPTFWALGVATTFTLVMGVFPQPLLNLVESAIYL